MENSNQPKNTKSIIVGYRDVPMQAAHLGGDRCPKCWLRNAKPGHFCRWNIKREGPRDARPKPVRIPIFGRKE